MKLVDGLVSAFAIGDGGKLRLLGSQASGGARPIHVSVHSSGRYLLCANWGSGSIAVLPIDADGALGATAQVVEHSKSNAVGARNSVVGAGLGVHPRITWR
jgi:6-phosphogluconolactonase